MHTEHLQNVSFSRVFGGWLVAVGVLSLVVLAFIASGVGADSPTTASGFASMVSVVAGFWTGGFFTGFRARRAPILHGIGMGLLSIVVWVIANLVSEAMLGSADWSGLDAAIAVAVVLAMIVSAIVGALMGYNVALRGKAGLSEDIGTDVS